MPLQNRVTPFGEIIADPARGGLFGNRGGRIHDPTTKLLLKRRWASRRWIACVLEFKGRRRAVMGDGYTELFFYDEATALASGHRPCFECRRADARAFAAAWARARRSPRQPLAGEMDEILHLERLAIFSGDRSRVSPSALPDGVMVARKNEAFLVAREGVQSWSPSGYGERRDPEGVYELLTPPSVVAALRAGYRPRRAEPSIPRRKAFRTDQGFGAARFTPSDT